MNESKTHPNSCRVLGKRGMGKKKPLAFTLSQTSWHLLLLQDVY